mgnify:CR=1 FL=1
MSYIQELKDLLEDEVILDLVDYIDELFALVAKKNDTIETKEELKNMQELKVDFETMLKEIEDGEMDEDEAKEIIEELEEMRDLNEED